MYKVICRTAGAIPCTMLIIATVTAPFKRGRKGEKTLRGDPTVLAEGRKNTKKNKSSFAKDGFHCTEVSQHLQRKKIQTFSSHQAPETNSYYESSRKEGDTFSTNQPPLAFKQSSMLDLEQYSPMCKSRRSRDTKTNWLLADVSLPRNKIHVWRKRFEKAVLRNAKKTFFSHCSQT